MAMVLGQLGAVFGRLGLLGNSQNGEGSEPTTRQSIMWAPLAPVYVSETEEKQSVVNGTVLNENPFFT